MVAGTAPPARTIASTPRAVSTLRGKGMPWAMIVLSRATTGRPAASARAISGATERTFGAVMSRGRGEGEEAGPLQQQVGGEGGIHGLRAFEIGRAHV